MADSYLLGAAYKPGAPAPRHRLRLHLTPSGVLHDKLRKHAIVAIDALGAATPSTAGVEPFELTIGRGLVLSDAIILSAPIATGLRMTWEVEGLLTFTDIGYANGGVIAMDVLPYVEGSQEIVQGAAQEAPQDNAVPRDPELSKTLQRALEYLNRADETEQVGRMAVASALRRVRQGETGGVQVQGDQPKWIDPTVFRDWLRRMIEDEMSGLGQVSRAEAGELAHAVAEQAKYILDGFSHKQGMYR